MRKKIVAGNWKMNGTHDSVQLLLNDVKNIQGDLQVIVFPPYIFIPQTEQQLQCSAVVWGAQNVSHQAKGAYTGEISANMLKNFACQYGLVGHSERRQLFAETDEVIAQKYIALQAVGMTPMLCVGETLAQHEAGETNSVVIGQLQAVIDKAGIDSFTNAVIAYEPVWAIGTGLTATPQQAQAVHANIREHFSSINATIASQLSILYGGSVKADNAAALFSQDDIDGGLIGGASLNADEFAAICAAI